MNVLEQTAAALVAPGKGILAADESSGTIKKRFDAIGTESTEDTRRAYRDMLFTTPGAEEFISGVILYDETIRQSGLDGTPFPKLLASKGIIPGIKVDLGAKPLAGAPRETVTEGLDGLRERLATYKLLGAGFAKWRAVIEIGDATPSRYCIETNAHALARYAALCIEAEIVPIVEPEVLMDGSHTIDQCEEVTGEVLQCTFDTLYRQNVKFSEILLKPNMIVPGKKCKTQASHAEVAARSVQVYRDVVPGAVKGIVFLSGGQSDEDATAHLNEMNKLGPHPWELSFSYGRALQAPALQAWKGETSNVEAGQKAYYHRARCNSAARTGSYTSAMEAEGK